MSLHDLTITSTDYGSDDKSWLGSAHGFDAMPTITLDSDLFTATFTDGHVPSGVTLGRVTASGLYGPYDDGAVDGRETMVGHLGEARQIEAGKNIPAPLFRHGQVIEANLPDNHGLNAAGKADVDGRIDYR